MVAICTQPILTLLTFQTLQPQADLSIQVEVQQVELSPAGNITAFEVFLSCGLVEALSRYLLSILVNGKLQKHFSFHNEGSWGFPPVPVNAPDLWFSHVSHSK